MKTFAIVLFLILASTSFSYSQELVPANENTLDSIREANKGNVLLINLWAYWCAPCKEEFPELIKLYNDYKDQGFKLVFVTLDFPETFETETIPYLKEQGVDWVTYYNNFDKDEQLITYMDPNWEGGIPGSFIYTKEGKLAVSYIGKRTYEVFETAVKKLL